MATTSILTSFHTGIKIAVYGPCLATNQQMEHVYRLFWTGVGRGERVGEGVGEEEGMGVGEGMGERKGVGVGEGVGERVVVGEGAEVLAEIFSTSNQGITGLFSTSKVANAENLYMLLNLWFAEPMALSTYGFLQQHAMHTDVLLYSVHYQQAKMRRKV